MSILKIVNGIFEVLSTNGDTYLGGDDFDHTIVEYWIQQYNINKEKLKLDKQLSQSLRLRAEEAKKHLSSNDRYESFDRGEFVGLAGAEK